jgi:glucan phosphoethanolaminetransferase (alkaline phosphatase superfamily)
MNKGQKTGLSLNLIGVVLFVIWLIIRSYIPTPLSILVAVIFLGLLGASLFLLIYHTRQAGNKNQK